MTLSLPRRCFAGRPIISSISSSSFSCILLRCRRWSYSRLNSCSQPSSKHVGRGLSLCCSLQCRVQACFCVKLSGQPVKGQSIDCCPPPSPGLAGDAPSDFSHHYVRKECPSRLREPSYQGLRTFIVWGDWRRSSVTSETRIGTGL